MIYVRAELAHNSWGKCEISPIIKGLDFPANELENENRLSVQLCHLEIRI
jgi:hypothetical protein